MEKPDIFDKLLLILYKSLMIFIVLLPFLIISSYVVSNHINKRNNETCRYVIERICDTIDQK